MNIITERFERVPLMPRLAAKLKPDGECLVFTGTKTDQGYGRICVRGKQVGAHRVAWELVHGQIPESLCVLHRCDNPSCCYVEHLFLGTVAENNADRATKNRSKGTFPSGESHPAKQRRGESHWCARLSAENISAIRQTRSDGESTTSLAARFGMHHATISRIARGIWRTEVSR